MGLVGSMTFWVVEVKLTNSEVQSYLMYIAENL